MAEKRMVAVDLGASGGKCFAASLGGNAFAMEEIHRFEHEGISIFLEDREGELTERTYWDDLFIYKNIVEGLHNYRREVSDSLDSIGIDTWGSDGQFISPDGDMLGKMYCYRDHRLDRMIEAVKARIDARRIYEITGIHFQPFNISNQLYWFVENRKDHWVEGSVFLPVSTLFYYYLGGVKQVDSTWASVTQLMDAREKRWSQEILGALNVPIQAMPEIVEPGVVLGELLQPLAEATQLSGVKLLSVGSHDTASAFAAAPVDRTDEALIISSGTWSLVGKLNPIPVTTDQAMKYNVSNEGGIGNVRCLKNCMGTWLVQELRRNWAVRDGKEMAWDEITRLASEASPFGPLIDPDDPSFFNPSNMEEAIQAFCKRTEQPAPKDRGTILRTVYESLAFKYRMVNEQICEVCENETKTVHIVGGGSKNKLLNQFASDCMGMPVLAGPEEATAVGNFMVQALGLGCIESLHEALPLIRSAFPIETFEPKDAASWNAEYDRFKKVCTAG